MGRVVVGEGRTAEVLAWGEGRVLKLYREGFRREGAATEARVTRLVHEAGLAAPAVYDGDGPDGLVDLEDRAGIVYERIDGVSMLREMAQRPWRLQSLLPDVRASPRADARNADPRAAESAVRHPAFDRPGGGDRRCGSRRASSSTAPVSARRRCCLSRRLPPRQRPHGPARTGHRRLGTRSERRCRRRCRADRASSRGTAGSRLERRGACEP